MTLSNDLQTVSSILPVIFLFILVAILTVRNSLSQSCGKCLSERSMSGKVVIVTGSNTGIGKETARDLSRRGAKVILACRDIRTAEKAAIELREENPGSEVIVRQCDLSSLKSVRNFADDINASEDRLDVLVCNAGSGSPHGRHLTEDGFELQFQTNHLGHFLLIHLLLDLMKRTSPKARIVITSSLAHRFGKIDLENMAYADRYVPHPFLTYCDTKLLNVILMKQLAHRLKDTTVTVNALHPGTVYTNGIRRNEIWYVKLFLLFMCFMYGNRTAAQGAQTIIHLAVSEELDDVSGQYFADCRPANYSPLADDQTLGSQVWDLSLCLTRLSECKNSLCVGD